MLYERCKLDVITARAAWFSPKLRPLSETERRYQLQDLAINDRGVRLDRAFATASRDIAVHGRIAIGLRLDELTGGTVSSPDQVARLLAAVNARGHKMTSLTRRAVAQVLAWVYQLKRFREQGGDVPMAPTDLDVPPELDKGGVSDDEGRAMVEELRSSVARAIGPIAKPREIILTPELPKTRSGKIMRRLLRDVAEDRELGDVTTLLDPGVVNMIHDKMQHSSDGGE